MSSKSIRVNSIRFLSAFTTFAIYKDTTIYPNKNHKMRAKDIICHKNAVSPATTTIAGQPSIYAEAHIIEVIERMVQDKIKQLSVTDKEENHIGIITRQSLLEAIAQLCNTHQKVTVIEVEMPPEDYTLTELARIVEENRCKIITLFAFPNTDSGMLRVQMRINCEEPIAILQSLERYNYRITATYRSEGKIDERAEQRLRELLYYLEM